MQWLGGMAGSKDQQHWFGQAGLSKEFLFTVVALCRGLGQGISVAGTLVPLEAVFPHKGFSQVSQVKDDRKFRSCAGQIDSCFKSLITDYA